MMGPEEASKVMLIGGLGFWALHGSLSLAFI